MSKTAKLSYEEGNRVSCDKATILKIESSSRYRKYNKSAHVACLTNEISKLSLVISPAWIPLISNKVSNSQTISL
jgi:cell wall assembly regulator SMI1